MKSILFAAALTVASLLTFGSASAQSKDTLRVTVPFAFVAGPAIVPAGNYNIVADPATPVVRFVNVETNRTFAVIAATADNPATGELGKLVFHHYGELYFLTGISQPHSSANLHFTQTKAEKRAKQRVLQAGLPIEDPILVGLN